MRGREKASAIVFSTHFFPISTRWSKRKGFAEIRLPSGELIRAELHWHEATGIGRREMKIKAFI